MSDERVHILGAFIDTLYLNVYPTDASYKLVKQKVSDELQQELELLKQRAQDEEENIPTRFTFDHHPLLMTRKGSEGFNWILSNRSIKLCINRSSRMLIYAQVRLSSEYLWKVRDLGKILSDVYIFLASVFGQYILLQPSALDMAVDLLGFQLPAVESLKECFISRAQYSGEAPANINADGLIDGPEMIRRRWGRITGLPFGARSAALSGIIYDKTHEIRYQSPEKAWFYDLWRKSAELQGIEYTEDMQVMRVEMRFRRSALREMKQMKQVEVDGEVNEETVFHGIDDAFMLESYLPGLWAYAVGHQGGGADGLPDGWLRYVVPSASDVNRSRWPVHPDWQVVQAAFPAPELETEKEREYREEQEEEALLQEVDAYLDEHPMSPTLTSKSKRKKSAFKRPVEVVPVVDPLLLDLGPYIRKRKHQINTRRMVAQLTGCMSTLEAWRALSNDRLPDGVEADISDTLSVYYDLAQQYMQEKNKDFSQIVQKKRVLYHIEEVKDNGGAL